MGLQAKASYFGLQWRHFSICSTETKHNQEGICSIFPTWNGDYRFEVTDSHFNSRVVDLKARSCSCRKWDLSGIHCCHAVASCIFLHITPEEIVDEMFSKETFLKTYNNMLKPINDKEI